MRLPRGWGPCIPRQLAQRDGARPRLPFNFYLPNATPNSEPAPLAHLANQQCTLSKPVSLGNGKMTGALAALMAPTINQVFTCADIITVTGDCPSTLP